MPRKMRKNKKCRSTVWELYFPSGVKKKAFLSTELGVGKRISLVLDPRFAVTLLVMWKTRLLDARFRSSEDCGWRSREIIGEQIGEITDFPVQARTVSTYLTELENQVKSAARGLVADSSIALIERRDQLGARIAVDVVIRVRYPPDLREPVLEQIDELQ